MADPKDTALLRALCRELAAAENRAELEPLVRARQLGVSSPAAAMIAIAVHARSVWPAFVIAAGTHELGLGLGRELATALASARYAVVDRWRDPQRAYRKTLSELHRGVHCAQLLREVATLIGRPRLVRWCDDMLPRRIELLDHANAAIAWFASHTQRDAIQPPRRLHLLRLQGGAL